MNNETAMTGVRAAGGRIVAVEQGAGGVHLSPGFIDIQINGFHGVNFSDEALTAGQMISVLPHVWKTGCTSFCPTLITNSFEQLERNFRVLEEARALDRHFDASVPCYHLEGPYISAGPSHGAHDTKFMKTPDWEEFSRLQEAARGRIGIVTIAPEWPTAVEFTRRAAESGVVVAIGHTDGTPEEVRAAVDAGATLSTHLGNGCPQMIHRHQFPIWAQLDDDRLTASLIPDGFHLPADFMRVALRVKSRERCVLITDAMYVTGLAPGRYWMVGLPIDLLPNGKVESGSSGSLGGSSVSMHEAVWRFARACGVTLEEAIECATRIPARLLGRYPLCPALEPGQPANVTAWREVEGGIAIEQVMVAGEVVYRAG